MWCARCQTDVVAEASADNQRLICATCCSDLPIAVHGPHAGAIRDPRELLAKWAREDALDDVPPSAADPPPAPSLPEVAESPTPDSRWWTALLVSLSVAESGRTFVQVGVSILAVAAGLVLLDFLGITSGAAPFGWMTALIGQTFLFLGVVRSVRARLERASEELSFRLGKLESRAGLRGTHRMEAEGGRMAKSGRNSPIVATHRDA